VAEPIDELMATADIAQGEKLAKVCAACHTFDKGGANRVGPNMWGIVGAKHAHIDGFAYSDALKAKSAEVWDVEALNQFLWNPKKAIPGTKMGYAGMKKPEDRAALIKWLETLK
jgi:cytochrome c